MTELLIHAEIDRQLESLTGELTSHSRVIDALLDIRGVSDNVHVIEMVENSLRNLPGKNAASTEWLRKQLTHVGLIAEVSAVVDPVSTHA